MPWEAIIGAGASLLGGALSSKSSSKASKRQLQAAREQAAAQERIADKNLAFQNKLLSQSRAENYPRMRASNSALQNVTDIMGLGDIYGAPDPNSLGGGQEFYPGAPVQGQMQQPAATGVNQFYNGMLGGGRGRFDAYVQANPDLLSEFARIQGGGFGPNLPASYDANGNRSVDRGEYGRFHYDKFGSGEGRQLPEDLLF